MGNLENIDLLTNNNNNQTNLNFLEKDFINKSINNNILSNSDIENKTNPSNYKTDTPNTNYKSNNNNDFSYLIASENNLNRKNNDSKIMDNKENKNLSQLNNLNLTPTINSSVNYSLKKSNLQKLQIDKIKNSLDIIFQNNNQKPKINLPLVYEGNKQNKMKVLLDNFLVNIQNNSGNYLFIFFDKHNDFNFGFVLMLSSNSSQINNSYMNFENKFFSNLIFFKLNSTNIVEDINNKDENILNENKKKDFFSSHKKMHSVSYNVMSALSDKNLIKKNSQLVYFENIINNILIEDFLIFYEKVFCLDLENSEFECKEKMLKSFLSYKSYEKMVYLFSDIQMIKVYDMC